MGTEPLPQSPRSADLPEGNLGARSPAGISPSGSAIRFPQAPEALYAKVEQLTQDLERARSTISGQGSKIDSQGATIRALSSTLEAQRADAFAAVTEKATQSRDRGIALGMLGLSTGLSGEDLISSAQRLAEEHRAQPLRAEQEAARILTALREHTKVIFTLAAELGAGGKRPDFSVLSAKECFEKLSQIRERLLEYQREQTKRKGLKDSERDELRTNLSARIEEAKALANKITEGETELGKARSLNDAQAREIIRITGLLTTAQSAIQARDQEKAQIERRLEAALQDLDLALQGEASASAANRILHLKAKGALEELERQKAATERLALSLRNKDEELKIARAEASTSPALGELSRAFASSDDLVFVSQVEAVLQPLKSSEDDRRRYFDALLSGREAPQLLAQVASRLSEISDSAAEREDEATAEHTGEVLEHFVTLTHDFATNRNCARFFTLMPIEESRPFLLTASKDTTQQLLGFLLVDPSLTHALYASPMIKILAELDPRVLAFILEKLSPQEAARMLCSAHLLYTAYLELKRWFREEAAEGTQPYEAAGIEEKIDLIEGVNQRPKDFPEEAQVLDNSKRYLSCLPLMGASPLEALLKELLSEEGQKSIYASIGVDTRDILLLAQTQNLTERVRKSVTS